MDGLAAPSLLGLDTRIWQAIVAGLVVAAGWLVNGWRNRQERRADRAERLRDAHRALFAEIRAYLSQLVSHEELERYRDTLIDRMERDATFVPFVPRERADRVFSSLLDEIHILPRVTIDPVVTYYAHLHAIEALADDMRGQSYANLPPDRRIRIYRDYVAMKVLALDYGNFCLRVIDAYAREGKDGAEAEARALSSPDAARSGP
ncbi:MAG: hypothetical protein AAGG09_21185 [Pseudomonadota bacterium]